MSETGGSTEATTGTATPTSSLGVVEPMRIPGADTLGRIWRGMPGLGRAFIVLAAVDIAFRALGIASLRLDLDLAVPTSLVWTFFPHTLLILLPAVVLGRRADAAAATPLIVQGAVAVALAELLEPALGAWLAGQSGQSGNTILPSTIVYVAGRLATAAGYVVIARGLLALHGPPSSPTLAGLANLVCVAIVAGAVTSLLLLLVSPQPDFGDPAWNALSMLSALIALVPVVAIGYLARTIIRGTVDARRPPAATYTASFAMVLAGIEAFLGFGTALLVLGSIAFAVPAVAPAAPFGFGWLGMGLVLSALVVAFGLGLADTSVRIPRRGSYAPIPAEPRPDPVHWPVPGGEVPVYRPIERPAEAQPASKSRPKPAKQRRGKSKESQP